MLNRTTIQAAVVVLAVFFFAVFNNRAQSAFVNGDFVTYRPDAWGQGGTTAAGVLIGNYVAVYPTTHMEVGIPSTGLSIILTGATFVMNLLPTSGGIGPLLVDETNQITTTSGYFGGEMVALKLNVDFSDAGFLPGAGGISFGDLVLTNLETLPLLNGLTVSQFLANSNILLGGGSGIYTVYQNHNMTSLLNQAFDGGTVSQFAQDHLRLPVDIGDFNQNGTVDAADYVVWRKTLQSLRQTAEFYDRWRATFGHTTLSATAQDVVPEPTTIGLALLALLALASRRRRTAGGSVRTSNH